MHRRTYERLVEKITDLEREYYGGIAVKFKFSGFENRDALEEGDP